MTVGKGIRARMQRRQELFSAELVLNRVLQHLTSSIAWARRMHDRKEWRAQCLAFNCVFTALREVNAEQEALQ